MAIPIPNMTITNNIMHPQNIVINQVPLTHHSIMSNVNTTNGIPIASALSHVPTTVDHTPDRGILMETIPMQCSNIGGIPTTVPVQNTSPAKTAPSFQSSNSFAAAEPFTILNRTRLNELARDTDPSIALEEEVEETLLVYADELIDRILKGAAMIAKHRRVNTVEVKDVQLFLTKNFGIWAPGFGTDELKPYKRSLMAESHKQRLALIRKALKKY